MAKIKPAGPFFCRECGAKSAKWTGKCMTCGAWSSLEEHKDEIPADKRRGLGGKENTGAVQLKEVTSSETSRTRTGSSEFDRVLGGGITGGSLILIGGDPGIGKSTLLLQVAALLHTGGVSCLYISGEESLEQIKSRAERINMPSPSLLVMCETDIGKILAEAEKLRPRVIVIDSIQTIYNPELPGTPGAETQLREAALSLMIYAKSSGCAVFMVGHVTKGGQIAGPKLIEHMVDTVIYFEGERSNVYRILRSVKNRFGAANEIGVFEMQATGLVPVENPSSIFIQGREERSPGSVITCSLEGSRPILLEIQALLNRSSFSNPQRVSMGMDTKRLTIILALLEKFSGIEIGQQDVFISVAGGLRISEPAADLAMAAAVCSSHLNRAFPGSTAVMGELGLSGEVRMISQLQARVKEVERMGFKRIIIPLTSQKIRAGKAEIVQVGTLQRAIELI